MVEALVIAVIVLGGFVIQYSVDEGLRAGRRWLLWKPRGDQDGPHDFDLRRPRDLAAMLMLGVGFLVGVVLVTGLLLFKTGK